MSFEIGLGGHAMRSPYFSGHDHSFRACSPTCVERPQTFPLAVATTSLLSSRDPGRTKALGSSIGKKKRPVHLGRHRRAIALNCPALTSAKPRELRLEKTAKAPRSMITWRGLLP